MRLEMLGLGFTVQHSDARVIEQLLYKWTHSKKIITNILISKYQELIHAGWSLNYEELKRDISFLFYRSYESFIEKKIKNC